MTESQLPPSNPWSDYDLVQSSRLVAPDNRVFVFYGRCSTEDMQDPEASFNWQLSAAQSVVDQVGGTIAATYFDTGLSRSLPWKRRPEASRLLGDMRKQGRSWDNLVVGEGQRCFYGTQFSDVAPLAEYAGVSIWIPDIGGRYDPDNASHQMMMSVTGGMSRGERQRVQERTRLAMSSQVQVTGRHQGGRPPYGYTTVAIGPHPNPRKAAEGFKLHRLEPIPELVPNVQWIFEQYLSGQSFRGIAHTLNTRGLPCPSAVDPDRNRHRRQDGWNPSTVRAILANAKYTGYQVWGQFKKDERLLDPDDASMGYETRLIRSDEPVVRSADMAHPPIISVETFVAANRTMAERGARYRDVGSTSRARKPVSHYLLQGVLRCAICGRKMVAERRGDTVRYRCRARDLVPGSEHPLSVSIAQNVVVPLINDWIASLFLPENLDETVEMILAAQGEEPEPDLQRQYQERQLAEAERKMTNFVAAIGQGVDVSSLHVAMSETQGTIDSLKAALADAPEQEAAELDEQSIRNLVTGSSDAVTAILEEADNELLRELYQELGLQLSFDSRTRLVRAIAQFGGTHPKR